MDKKLALIRNSSILRLYVYISTILCIILRGVLFICSVNILFNIEEIDTLKQTVLFKSAFLDRAIGGQTKAATTPLLQSPPQQAR